MMLLVAHNDAGYWQLRHALKRHRQWLWYDVNVLTTMKWTMILTMTKMDETPVRYGLTASLRRWHTMSNSNKCWRHMVPVAVAEGWGGNSLEINWKCARRSLSQYDLLNNTQYGGILSSNPLFAILLVLVKIAQHYWPCPSKWRGRERFSTSKTYPTRNCKTLLVSPCC